MHKRNEQATCGTCAYYVEDTAQCRRGTDFARGTFSSNFWCGEHPEFWEDSPGTGSALPAVHIMYDCPVCNERTEIFQLNKAEMWICSQCEYEVAWKQLGESMGTSYYNSYLYHSKKRVNG